MAMAVRVESRQLLLFVLLAVAQAASAASASSILQSSGGDGKVLVEMYSESLCPYCRNFIVNYLSKFFENGLIDIVDLRIIPYGNAHVYDDGSMICQHGEDECRLNVIQTCAISLWPDVFQWFPFVYCLEALDGAVAYEQWTSCVEPSGLDLRPLVECFLGPKGAQLELQYAQETDSLNPPHRYVPWVLVNGTPLLDDYLDVARFVCEAYQGPKPKPVVCTDLQRLGSGVSASSLEAGVCRAESAHFSA